MPSKKIPTPDAAVSPPHFLINMRAVAEATGEQIESVLAGAEDDEVIVKLKPLGNEKYLEALSCSVFDASKDVSMFGNDEMTRRLQWQFADMRQYAAGTHPDQINNSPENKPEPPPPQGVPVVFLAITDLGHARLLPEALEGSTFTPNDVRFEPGTIEQFMDADGRTMRIVNVGGQAHKAPAPFIPEQPTIEEA